MGRSKFPGKPSKHCLRKRINVLPPDGDLFNLVDIISPVTVTTSQDNKKDEEIEEKDTKNKPVKEVKTLKRRISRKLNTSLQKDGRKRAFIAKICAKTSLKVNKTTKRNNFSRNLTFKDSANLGGKFVLPTRSVHSSRVIKPNKRFIELNETLTMKKTVIAQRSVKRDGNKSRIKLARCKDSNFSKPEYDKTSDPNSHRVILRQARLKLPNHINTHVPFSTKTHNGPGTIICGICGAARYYRFVKHAKKFNIYSCESCRKFISKYIKRQNVGSNKSNSTLICLKGQGICYIPPIIRSQHWKINKGTYKSRCPACWLKACLKTYQLPPNLKHSLTQLLPQNMRGLDFSFNNTLPPLWQRNTERIVPVIKPAFQVASKHRPVRFKSSKTQSVFSLSVPSSEIKRQKIDLKGPRVKHVCRSASVALGQPVATFRSEVGKSCDTSDNLDPISKTNDQAKSVNWSVNKSDNLLLSDEDIVCDEHMSMVNYIFNENMDQSKRDRSLLLINGCVKSTETEPDEKGNDNFTSNEIYLDYSSDMNQDNSIKYGHCVIGSQQFSVTGICFLCGSGGKEPMLVCSACCQPYHTFCIEKQTPFTSHSLKGYVWICSMCIKCSECNNSEKPKIQCCKCQKFYHTDCFYSQWDTSGSERRALCKRCLRCNDCGSVFNVKCFPGNTMFCSSCLAKKKYSKKCPICHHTIDDETCCSAMLECGVCNKWIHIKCEKLSNEQYQLIRFLPISVRFSCCACHKEDKNNWKNIMFLEMRNGFEQVLRQLGKNKTARNILKRNPVIRQTPLKCIINMKKFHLCENDLDIDNNNCNKSLMDINQTDDFEENEQLEKSYISSTLLDIKNKLFEYNSVKKFHKDMVEALKLTHSEDVIKIYMKIFQDIFPWFNQSCNEDDRDIVFDSSLIESVDNNVSAYLPNLLNDTRFCVLCKQSGDGFIHERSRLLYCGSNQWVHANCAYWSSEVYEEIDNHLQNVHLSIRKSQTQICVICSQSGATIQCYVCSKETYHFSCARAANCYFVKYHKACFCPKHSPTNIIDNSLIIKDCKDFELRRSIFVEFSFINRPYTTIENVNYIVGSLSVKNLGKIEPLVSDNADVLIPMGFICTRLYWSTMEPWKLIPYTFITSIRNPNCNTLTVDKNFTVDHTLNKLELEKVLKELHLWQKEHDKKIEESEYEDEERNGDLLSPELTDTILEDLPHDILDGISVQDIFPNLLDMEFESFGDSFKKEDDGTNTGLKNMRELARNKPEIYKVDHYKTRPANQRSCSLTLSCKVDSTISPVIKKRKITAREGNINMYYQLLQVDGNCDDSSSSECGSPTVLQTFDTWGNCVSEEPVTCDKCHCTYRTQVSYRKHLDSCEVLCTSESDSENLAESEFLETTSNNVTETTNIPIDVIGAPPVQLQTYDSSQSECHTNDQNFISSTETAEVFTTPQQQKVTLQTLSDVQTLPVNDVINRSTRETPLESYTITQPAMTLTDQTISISNNQFCMNQSVPICVSQPIQVTQNTLQVSPGIAHINSGMHQSSIQIDTPLINGNQMQTISINPQIPLNQIDQQQSISTDPSQSVNFNQTQINSVPYNNITPVLNVAGQNNFTINSKLIQTNPLIQTVNMPGTHWVQKVNKPAILTQNLVKSRIRSRAIAAKKYDNYEKESVIFPTNNSGQVILQHLPSSNIVPFMDAFQHQNGQNVQYVATISPQVNTITPHIMQIQPEPNIISIMPGFQPTMIISQPRLLENQVIIDTSNSLGWSQVSQPPTVQPLYYGFETIVHNTVMQSQQFLPTTVPGVLTANSSYSTTTQVFQTSKLEPVLDVSSNGFVLLNSGQLLNSQIDLGPYTQAQPTTIISSQTPAFMHSQASSNVKSVSVPISVNSTINLPTAPLVSDQGIPMNVVTPIPKLKTSQTRPMSRVLPMPTNKTKSFKCPFDIKNPPSEHLNKKIISPKIEEIKTNLHKDKDFNNIAKVKPKAMEILENKIIKTSPLDVSKLIKMEHKSSEQFELIEKVTKIDFFHAEKKIKPIIENIIEEQKIAAQLLLQLKEPEEKSELNKYEIEQIVDKQMDKVQSISRILEKVEEIKQVNKLSEPVITSKKQLSTEQSSLKLLFQKQSNGSTYKVSNNCSRQASVLSVLGSVTTQTSPKEDKQLKLPSKLPSGSYIQKTNIKKDNDCGPSILYTIKTEEGFKYSSNSVSDCWVKVLEAVQNARVAHNMSPLPASNTKHMKSIQLLGLKSNHLKYLIEQLPDASKCMKYKPLFAFPPHSFNVGESADHKFGAVRCKPHDEQNGDPYDMFGWLSSKHRQPFNTSMDLHMLQSRRATNLPMSMKFRNLKITSKHSVGVYRSNIHGRGLFCLRDIEAGEMVIEYAGEVIRSILTDKREKEYNSKGIGCYMFRVDDNFVVDATMKGNAARFINHSCDPNCYSKVVEIHGHKHIIIFALRRIQSGEELTYDYKFPFEEDKIPCTCGAKKCRKFLN